MGIPRLRWTSGAETMGRQESNRDSTSSPIYSNVNKLWLLSMAMTGTFDEGKTSYPLLYDFS
jgi:hypothetical protein